MTQEEITAVAREYAEECAEEVGVKFNPQDWACSHCELEARAMLKFLLRRYYLVEKSKVEEEYHEANICRTHVERYGAQWGALTAKMAFMERLFPDLGKEVEG